MKQIGLAERTNFRRSLCLSSLSLLFPPQKSGVRTSIKTLGLVDLIGTYEDAKNLIKSLLNTEKDLKFVHPKHDEDGFFEYFLRSKSIELPFSNLNIFPIPEYRLYYGGSF